MVFPNTSTQHGAVARSAQRWQRLEGDKAWHGIVQEKGAKGEHFWWFHIFLEFSSRKLGENSHFDEHIFELGWTHQLVKDDLLEFLHAWDPKKNLVSHRWRNDPFQKGCDLVAFDCKRSLPRSAYFWPHQHIHPTLSKLLRCGVANLNFQGEVCGLLFGFHLPGQYDSICREAIHTWPSWSRFMGWFNQLHQSLASRLC